jgi:hypothetical protein
MISRRLLTFVLLLSATAARAQTVDDAVMMPPKSLCTGFMYSHDQWDQYWEGSLKRSNGNVGTLTTKSVTWMGTYGLTDNLNVIAMLPYVWTNATGGTLHGKSGLQDLSLAAKYRLHEFGSAESGGRLRAFAVASYGVPVTNYDPDLQPLSIGLGSQTLTGRLTLNYAIRAGLFANGSAAYTVRTKVTLDRPAYFTDGQLYLSDQVAMPDVFDYTVSVGYRKNRLYIPVSYMQQVTEGGGDIRRQDAPFISNKMNFSKIDGVLMYTLPAPKNLAVKLEATHTLTGRNVGQSTTLAAGLLYTIHFSK